jgi:hypothetical protein
MSEDKMDEVPNHVEDNFVPNYEERVMHEVPQPIRTRFGTTDLIHENKVNIPKLQQHFIDEGRLTNQCALELIKHAAMILRKEPNLLQLKDPMTGIHDLLTSSCRRHSWTILRSVDNL